MSEFTPHGFCLAWEPQLLWLTVIAHAGTALAYFGIPLMLLAASITRVLVIPRWLLAMFAAFILACGVSHMLEILVLWYPYYWTLAIEVSATALISLTTLYLLPLGVVHIRTRQTPAPDEKPASPSDGGDRG